MVKIVWTKISLEDLKEIFDYIEEDSTRYAEITINKIYQRIQNVKDNPFIGRIVPEIDHKLIRELVSGHYRIIYKIVSEYQVDVLRVYHSARLLKNKSLK